MKSKLLFVIIAVLLCQLLHAQNVSANSAKVFPNPATSTISVIVDTVAKVTIYNLLGESQIELVVSTGQTDVKVTDLQTGYYLVQLLFGQERFTKRIYKK